MRGLRIVLMAACLAAALASSPASAEPATVPSAIVPRPEADAAAKARQSVLARASERLPAVARRIVSLDDFSTELLVSLGIEPVAVANLASYRRYVGIGNEQLADSVTLGTPQQPDLEGILRARPDLIVGVAYLHMPLHARLDALAPTVLLDVSLAPGPRDGVALGEDALLALGDLTDRRSRAADVIADSRAAVARARQRIADAGLAGHPLVALYPMSREGTFIVSNERTLIVSLLARLGATSPWRLSSAYSLHRRIGIEELAPQQDLTALFVGGQQQAPMFRTPMWQALPVARDGRFAFLPTPYWTFGGPVSAARLADQIVQAVDGMPTRATAP
jgi:iron complex transport system substrate-binding protein